MTRPSALSLLLLLVGTGGCTLESRLSSPGLTTGGQTGWVGASGGAGSTGTSTGGVPAPEASSGGAPDLLAPLDVSPPSLAGYQLVESRDVSALFPPGAALVGLTIDPDTGAQYVLDPEVGIYELGATSARLIHELSSLAPEDGTPATGPLTDLARVGQELFAVTGPNEGFFIDLGNRRMWRHFCYLPDFDPGLGLEDTSLSVAFQQEGVDVYQLTEALTYESTTGLLWAEPRTFLSDSGEVVGSELASFDVATGTPQTWLRFAEIDFRATGLVVQPEQFVFAVGASLVFYARDSGQPISWQDFSEEGVGELSGLAPGPGEDLWALERGTPTVHRFASP